MKLVGELKLSYKTVDGDSDTSPQRIGDVLVDTLAKLVSSKTNGLPAPRDTDRASYTVVKRYPRAPEICPIDTIIEARLSFFEEA